MVTHCHRQQARLPTYTCSCTLRTLVEQKDHRQRTPLVVTAEGMTHHHHQADPLVAAATTPHHLLLVQEEEEDRQPTPLVAVKMAEEHHPRILIMARHQQILTAEVRHPTLMIADHQLVPMVAVLVVVLVVE